MSTNEPLTREGAIIRNQRSARSFMGGYLAAQKRYGAPEEDIAQTERAIEQTREREAEAYNIMDGKRYRVG